MTFELRQRALNKKSSKCLNLEFFVKFLVDINLRLEHLKTSLFRRNIHHINSIFQISSDYIKS